jgi:hypothetical protein
MKRFLLLTWLVVIVASPLFAQQDSSAQRRPPSVDQVMKFFDIMQLREKMQTMLQMEQKQSDAMITDLFNKRMPDATAAQRAQFKSIVNDAINGVFVDYPIDDILRDMVPVYQSHLSESDLSEIVAFYSSPVGQKVIREMPAMTAEGMRVSLAHLQPRIDAMMKTMTDRLENMATGGK